MAWHGMAWHGYLSSSNWRHPRALYMLLGNGITTSCTYHQAIRSQIVGSTFSRILTMYLYFLHHIIDWTVRCICVYSYYISYNAFYYTCFATIYFWQYCLNIYPSTVRFIKCDLYHVCMTNEVVRNNNKMYIVCAILH